MKTILVTTDLSNNSKSGLRFALAFALRTKSKVLVSHVCEIMKPTSWSNLDYAELMATKTEEINAAITKLLKECAEAKVLKKISPSVTIDFGMNVPDLIISRAKKARASFICTSTRGAGKYEKLLGTVASELVTTSPVAMLVIPKAYKTKELDRIMFACDFANLSAEMKRARELQTALKAKLDVFFYDYLLHVPEVKARLERRSKAWLRPDTKFHFQRQEIDIPLHKHFEKDIAKVKPAIFMLFTKQNRNWFDRIFSDSEGQSMAFQTKVPLLTYRKKIKK